MEDADPENVSGASDDDSDSASEDDSDSGSDSDDGDEDVAMPDESATAKIMKLERRLESDPGDYGAHVQLCASLREWPSLRRRLRDAREAFAERFPLNETQWREWIADEVRHTKGKREARATVVGALFERAVSTFREKGGTFGAASASPSGFGAARKPIPRCRTEGDALRMAMAEGYDVNDVEHGGAGCVVS